MSRHIDDSMDSWQRPGLRTRLVFALLAVLVALSYALLLTGEEAHAKGGKRSSEGGSAEGAIGESAKPSREVAGEVNKRAGNEKSGGKDAGSTATREPAPRADKPAQVDDGPVKDAARSTTTEQVADKEPSAVNLDPETDRSVAEQPSSPGEVAGTAREATRRAVESSLDETSSTAGSALEGENGLPRTGPILDEAARLPEVEPILEETLVRATSETEPVLESTTAPIRPMLEKSSSTVEPLLSTASSKVDPVLDKATAPVGPVLEEAASTVEPVLEEANTTAVPMLEEANSPVEPVLTGTLPGAAPAPSGEVPAATVGEAVEPAAWPPGEGALPTVGPVLGEMAFPAVESALGAAPIVVEPASEGATPAVGSGFGGEVAVYRDVEPPTLESNGGAILASSPALASHDLATEAWGAPMDPHLVPATLGSARYYSPVRDTPPASATEPPLTDPGLFDGSFVFGGSHAALPGAIAIEDAREGSSRQFPSGFPPAAPPTGISFGSSGAGKVLDLLAVLAFLATLSRVGGLSWSNHVAFKLGSSLRLAVERPG